MLGTEHFSVRSELTKQLLHRFLNLVGVSCKAWSALMNATERQQKEQGFVRRCLTASAPDADSLDPSEELPVVHLFVVQSRVTDRYITLVTRSVS